MSTPQSAANGKRRASSNTATTTKETLPWQEHALRQLKLILPGAAVTYYLGIGYDFVAMLQGDGGNWAQLAGLGALLLGITTVSLFVYVILLPWLTGEEPNYQSWRESGTLSFVIPVLTGSIVIGWSLAVITLGQWSPAGYLRGAIGVSALYALTLGLLGLIPIPRMNQKVKP